ncbi:DNA-binding response regulator [Paenibacillus antibioticophila]|uniref:DNA-binding response regulator n=1 Tax=Paenibacillus antibioticophila TaxID=1274374 RepID=A0A920CD66_9BACL|nr:response regulator transcription factor [Paenibacillus antibioticophila]GIO35501.1 DNA-binding response regulator [Paenibacillus antibioticophila]
MTKQIHVVVIDNQPAVRAGIKIILEEDTSIKVIGSAQTGKEGLELIEQLNPSVVLLELKLPDGPGLNLIRYIRERFPLVSIIIYTGYNFEPFLNEIIDSGVSGVMNKSASTKEIHQLIRNVINGYTMIPLTIFSRMKLHRSPEVRHYWEIDLTDSEKRMISLISQKYTNVKIANKLNSSESSVENYLKKLYSKLGVTSNIHLIMEG